MEINKPVKLSVARTVFYCLCIWSPGLGSYLHLLVMMVMAMMQMMGTDTFFGGVLSM